MRGVLFAQTGGANNAGICKSLLRVSGVAEHEGVYYQAPIADGLAFDENGNVVEAALMPRPQLDDDEFY